LAARGIACQYQFRTELAQTIGFRSELDAHQDDNFSALEGFLQDAPAASKGIKKLNLNLGNYKLDYHFTHNNDICARRFDFFAESMKLEVLEIWLLARENSLLDIDGYDGIKEWYGCLSHIRKLVVTK
jgi:hypothetical protein